MSTGIVAKFGGSSVKDGNAMLRCSHILENNPAIKVTIISATYNTTNQLELVAKTAESGDPEMLSKVIAEIESKHHNIAKELFSSQIVYDGLNVLNTELKEIAEIILKNKLSTFKEMDQLYSLGERMSSLIFSDLLKLRIPTKKIIHFDARKVIKTNSDFKKAEPQIELISEKVRLELGNNLNDPEVIIVTEGFIGEDLLGQTTTLGREGSDYSAALLGEAMDASLIQIWTDVAGVATADPRIVSNTQFIKNLSYDEATALATHGAKVLFPRTLLPAKRKNIPVFVGSSLSPTEAGTLITNEIDAISKIKAVTSEVINNERFLSFVGSHLEKMPELSPRLLTELNNSKHLFEFFDLTSVSITFKFSEMSTSEAMIMGHKILSTI